MDHPCFKEFTSLYLMHMWLSYASFGCTVKMVQDGTGRCEAVSNVLVSDRAYEHFFDGGKKKFSKSLVGAIILVEECGRGI